MESGSHKKYALHPGWITSKFDGEEHYIGISKLADLYELRPGEYHVWQEPHDIRCWDDYIHLYPSYDGNYGRPQQ